VRNLNQDDRYVFALFLDPNPSAIIKPFSQLVSKENPSKYQQCMAGHKGVRLVEGFQKCAITKTLDDIMNVKLKEIEEQKKKKEHDAYVKQEEENSCIGTYSDKVNSVKYKVRILRDPVPGYGKNLCCYCFHNCIENVQQEAYYVKGSCEFSCCCSKCRIGLMAKESDSQI